MMVPETDIDSGPADAGMDRPDEAGGKVKLEIYGEEMIEKVVKQSGNSGRIYLPPNWVGCRVKIIRLAKEEEPEP